MKHNRFKDAEPYHRREFVGPTTDLSKYKDVVIPPDVQEAETRLYQEYLEPFKLDIPAYAKKWIYEAALATGADRMEKLEQARKRFEQRYLAAWASGKIKVKDDAPPMPEEVKAHLKELNKQRREAAKEWKEAKPERVASAGTAGTTSAAAKEEKPKRSKTPVFSDPDAQKMVLTKYPHVIPGTFKKDPEKPGGTILDIKCKKCGANRTIHLADAFQVKLCLACRGNT